MFAPRGKVGAEGSEPGSPAPLLGAGVVVIPKGSDCQWQSDAPGKKCGAVPAWRDAGLGLRGPHSGVAPKRVARRQPRGTPRQSMDCAAVGDESG